MQSINITVTEKVAVNTTPDVVIVCGNSGYKLTFDFDAEWENLPERTARLVYTKNGENLYQDVPFTGDTVTVPVLSNIDCVFVGVYAGDLCTTTPAKVLCDKSILCGNPLEEMTPEVSRGLQAQIGKLSDLLTPDKSSLVAAINTIALGGGNGGSAAGCLVVNATLSKGRYVADRSTSEIYAALQVGADVRLFDESSGTNHHVLSSTMMDATFSGVEPDPDNSENMRAVVYRLSPDNTVMKTSVAIDGGSAGIDAETLQEAVDDALAQAKDSGEFNGAPGTPGRDGVGIASVVQTTTSSADGGNNVVTVTLTDGTIVTFTVKNGSKGSPGANGLDGGYYVPGVTQTNSGTMEVTFAPSKTGMEAIPDQSISLPQGPAGADGGYYTIDVEQLNSQNVKLSFTPSKEGMEAILPEVITLPQGPKGEPGADGEAGARGTGLLPITTAPSSYTTTVNGLTPTYRIALSTVKSQAGVTEVFAGDTLRYSYYHYPVIYVDASYVYCGARVSIRGATGAAGEAGYTPVRGTDYWTAADIAQIKAYVDEAILGGAW